MREEYEYRFHPSILRTNRQIEREASRVLYTENLLIRVSSSGRNSSSGAFGGNGKGHALPILATEDHAKRFTRHVMEIVMLRDYVPNFATWDGSRYFENCFIIASDDLPRFCWILFVNNSQGWEEDELLSRLALAVEIRHDMDVSTTQGETTTGNGSNFEYEVHNEDKAKLEGEAASGGSLPNDRIQTSTSCSDIQIRRLLEPLRRLHSIQVVHIEGPVSEHYKAPLEASMCGRGPSDKELFDVVLATYEDARITYDTGDLSSAVTKMKQTLDIIDDYKDIAPGGPQGLSPLWDACKHMQFTTWTNLGWASLKKRENYADVWDAHQHVETLVCTFVDEEWQYANLPSMGHDIAMVFYLMAKVWEAFDDLGEHDDDCRSHYLGQVVSYLKEGLHHEPRNKMLAQELKSREEHLENTKELEDLMEMSDRIYERGEFAPRGRGGFRSRGRGRGRGH